MRSEASELIGDCLILCGTIAQFVSLFLPWSHLLSPSESGSVLAPGVPRDPTAWQAYSVIDVGLALVALALLMIALLAGLRWRLGVLVPVGLALAFTIHALSVPPTSGANVLDPAASVPRYVPVFASAGSGETVAIAALGAAVAGVVLSLTAEIRRA